MNEYPFGGIPLEAQYLYRKALLCSMNGKPEQALDCLRQAVVIAPRYSNALYEMGDCLDQIGRPHEAVLKYEAVLKLDPDHGAARSRRDRLRTKLQEEKQHDDLFFLHPVPELRMAGRTLGELISAVQQNRKKMKSYATE